MISTIIVNRAKKIIFDALYRNAPYNQGQIADEIIRDLEKDGWEPPAK
ncbi:hypothetical protein LCGC14_0732930 [marine sediment metagenome]|uniref:Uncharacterized protein n=1 Tax=marine sediment metagenome TaxID=412755 RepID=A0A0F9QD78_9ZZZZ